jgi:prevent-host-death family protein
MTSYGMFDAKNHFSEIVERVRSTGRAVTVTNRGEPVAQITPAPAQAGAGMSRKQAFAELDQLCAEVEPLKKGQVRRLIDEGRQ